MTGEKPVRRSLWAFERAFRPYGYMDFLDISSRNLAGSLAKKPIFLPGFRIARRNPLATPQPSRQPSRVAPTCKTNPRALARLGERASTPASGQNASHTATKASTRSYQAPLTARAGEAANENDGR